MPSIISNPPTFGFGVAEPGGLMLYTADASGQRLALTLAAGDGRLDADPDGRAPKAPFTAVAGFRRATRATIAVFGSPPVPAHATLAVACDRR